MSHDYSPTWIDREVPGLQDEILSWVGTRYKEGVGVKGKSTDCLRFVCQVLCSLLEIDEPNYGGCRAQIGLHSPGVARGECARIVSHFPSAVEVTDDTLAPGDVVILGPPAGGPTMAMIASETRFLLYRVAESVGVVATGFDIPHREVKAVYRLWEV